MLPTVKTVGYDLSSLPGLNLALGEGRRARAFSFIEKLFIIYLEPDDKNMDVCRGL
jgi:hypothetical protein